MSFQKGDLVRCVDEGDGHGYDNPPVGTVGVVTSSGSHVAGHVFYDVSWFIDGEWAEDYMEEEIEHVQEG